MGGEVPEATQPLLAGLRPEPSSLARSATALPRGDPQSPALDDLVSQPSVGASTPVNLPPVESILSAHTFEQLLVSRRVESLGIPIRCQECGSNVMPYPRAIPSRPHYGVSRTSAQMLRPLSAPSSPIIVRNSESPGSILRMGYVNSPLNRNVSSYYWRLAEWNGHFAMQSQSLDGTSSEGEQIRGASTSNKSLETGTRNDVRRMRRPKTRKVWSDFERDAIKEHCQALLSSPAYRGQTVLPSDSQTWETIKNALWNKYPGRFQRSRQGIMELARKMNLRRGTREEFQKRQEGLSS